MTNISPLKIIGIYLTASLISFLTIGNLSADTAETAKPPFIVKEGLFDRTDTKSKGLEKAPGTETYSIFKPQTDKADEYYSPTDGNPEYKYLPFIPKFNHNVILTPTTIDGKEWLYASWQACPKDEDKDSIMLYSRSSDGVNWSLPEIRNQDSHVTPPCPPINTTWDGKTYVRYRHEYIGDVSREMNRYDGPGERRTKISVSSDGEKWTKYKWITDKDGVPMNGWINPHIQQPDGTLICIGVKTGDRNKGEANKSAQIFFTKDKSGVTGWQKANFELMPAERVGEGREIESSWFRRTDGSLVAIWRDMHHELRVLASESRDGISWSKTVKTNMPDSASMQCAGVLPDGTVYMINNPNDTMPDGSNPTKRMPMVRSPIAITLSKDGYYFDKSYAVRSELDRQEMRFKGRAKINGYSYPSSLIWHDHIYISYATNKEDAEYTRIPLKSLKY